MSSSNQAPPKKSKGRQKVTMVKMENQSNLQVTFSKRRAGLFKKASELCTLCGAEAAIVVFSPANKVYCFGHPNAQMVCDRFEGGSNPVPINNTTSQLIIEAHRNSAIRELNLELTQVESMLRAERKREKEIDMIRKSGQTQHWFPPSFDEFNFAQLCVLKESIMGFKNNFDAKVQKDMLRLANPVPFYPPAGMKENPFLGLSLGVDANVSDVPTYNASMLFGSTDFGPSYAHGAVNDVFPHGGTLNSSFPPASHDYLRDNGSSSSSSFKLPNDSRNMEFGMSPGFNISYGTPRMF